MGAGSSVVDAAASSTPSEDVFLQQEIDQLLSSVLTRLQDSDDRSSFEELRDKYRESLVQHFCGGRGESEGMVTMSLRRSTALDLQPFFMNCFLRDKVGVTHELHRQLMTQCLAQYGAGVKQGKVESERSGTDEVPEVVQERKGTRSIRKTMRFITHINLAEKRIACVRRTVTPSDFAISHRWHNRPVAKNWQVVEHVHSEDCWETGECKFIDFDPCSATGEGLYCNYIDKEWTVVSTCVESLGGRTLMHRENSYKCSLFTEEAENLCTLLAAKRNLWCDYVCINQSDPCDKIEQIPLMGNLYYTACTLILGPGFGNSLPPDDYIYRAWCIQERDYGSIECPWNFDEPDFDKFSLRQFVLELTKRIPVDLRNMHLHRHSSQGMNLCAVFEYIRWFNFENEPINEMNKDKILKLSKFIERVFRDHLCETYPECSSQNLCTIMQDLLKCIENVDYDDDDLNISLCFLKLREAIQCSFEVQPLTCQYQVFDSQATYAEDRIYAIWGVPMWMRNQQQLPYPHHHLALKAIFNAYPTAEFAFYRRPNKFVSFTYFAHVQDVMLNFITGGKHQPKKFSCAYHVYQLSTSNEESCSCNSSIVVAVDEECAGVGLKQMSQENSEAEMWVVFRKKALKLMDEGEQDMFCRLCFVYILYEVGLFNKENYLERKQLYNFCRGLI